MRPIQYYAHNAQIGRLIKLVLDAKRLKSFQVADQPRDIPFYYQGPVIVDGDITVMHLATILCYLDERFPEYPLIPNDPKLRAWTLMTTMALNLDTANQTEAIKELKRHTSKFIFGKELSLLDLVLGSIDQDQQQLKAIASCC